MAIGVISDEAFVAEASRFAGNKSIEEFQELSARSEIVEKDIKRGRGNVNEIPAEIRALVAQELFSGAPLKETAEAFNVSTSSASAYKNGATSTATYDTPNEELKKSNDDFKNKIKDLASVRLIAALDSITPGKLLEASLKTASSVAKDMSQVIKNVAPEINEQVHNQVIIFKPRMKEEDEYDVIDVQKIEA